MLVSTYHLSDTERAGARRVWIDARPFVIGRASDCDVIVDDPDVALHHLRVDTQNGAVVVENLGGVVDVDGTLVPVNTSLAVDEGRPIRIGGTIVKVRLQAQPVVTTDGPPQPGYAINPPMVEYAGPPGNPPAPRPPPPRLRAHKKILSANPAEQSLLSVLRANPSDTDSRMVYADWLEGNGLNAKAQLVQLREHLDTFMHKNATDLDWRVVAVRTPIDHCIHNKCPAYWDALVPMTGGDFVRRCTACKHEIRYCADRNDVRSSGGMNLPVVFDASLDRVEAHAWYKNWTDAGDGDEIDDDPDGYTLDVPPSNFRR